ncbi:MAG: FecR domain-containing protein [Exilibacterium sp.]
MADQQLNVQVDRQVAEWIGLFESGDMTPEQFEEFLLWRDATPRHKTRFETVHALWCETRDYPLPKPRQVPGEAHSAAAGGRKLATRIAGALKTLFEPPCVIATSVVMTVLVLAVFIWGPLKAHQPEFLAGIAGQRTVTYVANRAETLKIVLDDGSRLHVKALSKVVVAYSGHERRVVMKRGEALFEVARDIRRPFRVFADKGVVEAVGTQFSVDIDDGRGLNVKLIKGVIKVSSLDQNNPFDRVLTRPGHNLMLRDSRDENNQPVWQVEETYFEDPALSVAWMDGRLIFRGITLEKAIDEINRYSHHTLVLADSSLAGIPIHASIDAGDWREALRAIEASVGIETKEISADLTYLYSRQSR